MSQFVWNIVQLIFDMKYVLINIQPTENTWSSQLVQFYNLLSILSTFLRIERSSIFSWSVYTYNIQVNTTSFFNAFIVFYSCSWLQCVLLRNFCLKLLNELIRYIYNTMETSYNSHGGFCMFSVMNDLSYFW